MTYPNSAGFKRMDTSRDGATHATATLGSRQTEVIADLQAHGPSTAEQVAARTGRHWLHVRPRISELKALGRVVDTGERVATGMGGKTHVVRLATAEELAAHHAREALAREKAA